LATVTEFMVNGSLRHALLKKDRLLNLSLHFCISLSVQDLKEI
jgi:hypothetical protein